MTRRRLDRARFRRTPLRWRIAFLVDQHARRSCWADLVSFALGDRRTPWQPITGQCHGDAARNGSCYCGKLRADGTIDRGRWSS